MILETKLSQEQIREIYKYIGKVIQNITNYKFQNVNYQQCHKKVYQMYVNYQRNSIQQLIYNTLQKQYSIKLNTLWNTEYMFNTLQQIMGSIVHIVKYFSYLDINYFKSQKKKCLRDYCMNILSNCIKKNQTLYQLFIQQIVNTCKNININESNQNLQMLRQLSLQLPDFLQDFKIKYLEKVVICQYGKNSCQYLIYFYNQYQKIKGILSTNVKNPNFTIQLLSEMYKKLIDKQQILNELTFDQLFKRNSKIIIKIFELNKNDLNQYFDWYTNLIFKKLNNLDKKNIVNHFKSIIDLYQTTISHFQLTIQKHLLLIKFQKIFEKWINNQQNNIITIYNIYLSHIISNQSQTIQIQKQIILFKYLKDKDLFQKAYRKLLLKRIMQDKFQYQIQSKLIKYLKVECGILWVSKLEYLINQCYNNTIIYKIDQYSLKGYIFPQAIWPYQILNQNINLLNDLNQYKSKLLVQYNKSNPNRKLKWLFQLGQGTVRIQFEKGHKLFVITTIMINLLLYVNIEKQCVLKNFIQLTNYKIQNVKKNLYSLYKNSVIFINPKPQRISQISQNSIYQLNVNFTHKSNKLKIVLMKEEENNLVNYEEVKNDRKIIVEGIIIKLLKCKKIIQKQELMEQCKKHVLAKGFVLKEQMIKSCIQSLTNRDYIKQNIKSYEYIA